MPEPATGARDADQAPSPARTLLEMKFLIAIISATLLAAISFVLVSQIGRYGLPSPAVAILFGIAIASLAYAFLGGIHDASFSIGALKVGGAVAVIIGTFWAVQGPMDKNMNTLEKIAKGENAEKLIKEQTNRADAAEGKLVEAKNQITKLQDAAETREEASVAAHVKRIADSSPNDDLGRDILQLERERKGPWRRDLQTLQLSARFIGTVQEGTFRFCHGKHPELAGQQVEFEVVDAAAGTSKTVQLRAGADIGAGLCSKTEFDVQLGCDAVDSLIKDVAPTCDPVRGVGWSDPNAVTKAWDLTATILNTEVPH